MWKPYLGMCHSLYFSKVNYLHSAMHAYYATCGCQLKAGINAPKVECSVLRSNLCDDTWCIKKN